jgi:predicted nucleotide-binding protein (sugar kinase/HSP70/actin superfamily)
LGDQGESINWGHLCGRDPEDKVKKKNQAFHLMKIRDQLLRSYVKTAEKGLKTIGLPSSLTTYTHLPLWAVFFAELGFNIKLSPKTNSELSSSGMMISGAEFCHPVRVSTGHILHLLESVSLDYVFVPSHLETFRVDEVTKSWFCPLVIQNPYYSHAALSNHSNAHKFISVSINFNWPAENIKKELSEAFKRRLNVSSDMLTRAWDKGIYAQKHFEENCQQHGRLFLEELDRDQRDCIVIIGRPYSVYDYGINLNLPKRIAEYGYPVIPLEFIPYNEKTREELKDAYWNLYWAYGQRMLNAIEYIRKHPNLYPICFTNFKCGPDSYVLTYIEASIKDKPLLTLEFDEHNSEGGYITRLEAFFDTIKNNPTKTCSKYEADMVIKDIFEVDKSEPIFIPSSPDNMVEAYGAVFRRFGFDARICPPVTEETYNLGRAFTRGSECSPAVEMVSNFLEVLQNSDQKEFNFAMADSTGPCRMGQYSYLYNVIFRDFKDKKINFVNVQISVDTKDSVNPEIKKTAYRGMVVLDLLKKALLKTRPYEIEKGKALSTFMIHKERALKALEHNEPLESIFVHAIRDFKNISIIKKHKPLVGIVGEYFVTTSDFINQRLIETIEAYGGEAWLVPHADFTLWYSVKDFQVLHKLKPFDAQGIYKHNMTVQFLQNEEHMWIVMSEGFLNDRAEPTMAEIYAEAKKYMHEDVPNETLPTVGRSVLFAKRDKVDLIVNCKPFSCMPGNASEAILQKVKEKYDIPVITVNYEGTGDANKSVVTMLLNLA